MVKYLSICLLALMLVSCATQPTKTVYVDKNIPVYIVPAPPKVEKPILIINSLTDAQKNNIGELTKAYAISLKQTMQYACKLKNIVDKYTELSLLNPSLIMPVPTSVSLITPSLLNKAVLNVNVEKDCNIQ